MRKLMMLAGTIVLLSLLAAPPAFAQTDVCENPFREVPTDGDIVCVKPGACPANAPPGAREFGEGNDLVCAFVIEGEDGVVVDGDRDGDGFIDDLFDEPFISQDIEQEAESGDIDQDFEVIGGGDNSNQTVGIQGTANTGNVQNVIDVVDAGDFVGDFDDNEFVDDEDVICFDENGDNIDDLDGVICVEEDGIFGDSIFGDGIFDDVVCFDDFGNRINTNDERCIIVDDGDFGDFGDFDDNNVFGGDGIDELEFDEVGSTIEMSPEQTVTSSQQVNQAAAASGDDDCVPVQVWDPWWQTWTWECLPT